MDLEINDERLVAYLLGELDESEREAVEKVLESDETLQKRIAELRATAKLAAEAFQAEPAYALTASQREAIVSTAEDASKKAPQLHRLRWRKAPKKLFPERWQVAAAAAALLVLGVVVAGRVLIVPSPLRSDDLPALRWQDHEEAEIGDLKTLGSVGDALPKTAPPSEEKYAGDFFFGYADAVKKIPKRGRELKAATDASVTTLEASQPDRYLIKNANLVIETEDARKASEQLVAAVQELGGYVSDFRESVDGLGHRSIQMQVRIPADQFQETMSRLGTLGRVLNRHITTEDVTEEYVDTDARLRNLKRTEERLLAHLDRTGELKGIVEVERELNRVREEIERLEGRLRYLTHRVDYSTFNVTLQEKPKAEPVVPPETFSLAKIASQATRGLVGFLQGLSKCLIWLGIWSVVWVPLLVLVVFLVRRGVRR